MDRLKSSRAASPAKTAWSVREADFPATEGFAERMRFLLRYAVLAPSARNTQPWFFVVRGQQIGVHADLSRRLNVADPHARDLYVSVGCALENLLVAAAHFGLNAHIEYFPLSANEELVARLWFGDGAAPAPKKAAPARQTGALFAAITRRHTQDASGETPPLSSRALAELRAYAKDKDTTLSLLLTQEAPLRRAVEGMLARAGGAAHADNKYLQELAACPPQRERSAFAGVPAFGLISAAKPNRLAEVKAGQLLERLALRSTLLDLCLQPLSMLLDFQEIAAVFAKLFRAGDVPLVPFRIGARGPSVPPAPRRPLEEVLR